MNRFEIGDYRFDEKELKNLKQGYVYFVVTGSDLFADKAEDEWIKRTLEHCRKYDNKYLLGKYWQIVA